MKKIASVSLITAVALSAQILPSQVLKNSSLSIENGGAIPAIDAYSDGGGIYVIGDNSTATKPVDNSPMNELVFKYGETAKANNTTLVNEVKNINETATLNDKALADKIIIDGASCSDGNTQTINDKFVNNVCVGKNTMSPTCSDATMTMNNSICSKIGTYDASPSTLKGYTISGDTYVLYSGKKIGFLKMVGGFKAVDNTNSPNGAITYLLPDGTLANNSCTANCYTAIVKSGSGFYFSIAAAGAGNVVNKAGTSISASSIGAYGSSYSIQKTATGFKVVLNGVSGADVQWEELYDYTCPNGGTLSGISCLNGTITTPAVCNAGYSLVGNLCVEN